MTGDGGAGVQADGGAVCRWCDAYGNAGDAFTGDIGTGTIELDPLLADPFADDLTLAPGSPCIDAGDPAAAALDPDGTRNDIGAYGGPDAWP